MRKHRWAAVGKDPESSFVRCSHAHETVEADVGLGAEVDEVRQYGIRLSLSALLAPHHRCHAWYEPLEVARIEPWQDESRITTTILIGESPKPHLLVIAD